MIGFTSALKDFGVLQSGSESSESLEQASQVKTEKNRMSLAFFMIQSFEGIVELKNLSESLKNLEGRAC